MTGMSSIDQAAFDAAVASGLVQIPTADAVAELVPRQAVLTALQRLLERAEGRVENPSGASKAIAFKRVLISWPSSWEPSVYPLAAIDIDVTDEMDAVAGVPVRIGDEDVISPDDRWALWRRGEDVGEGTISVFATYEPQANALGAAVEDALGGNLDTRMAAVIPLPDAALPAPFQGRGDIGQVCRVQMIAGGTAPQTEQSVAANIWRVDVRFSWQAPRLAARRRIPDLVPIVDVVVGQETAP